MLWCNTSFADFNGLAGVKEFQLSVRISEGDSCGVTKYKLENSLRYILSNSKIKLVEQSPSLLNLNVTILSDEVGCFGHSDLSALEWRQTKNIAQNDIVAPLLLWQDGRFRKGPPDSFEMKFTNTVENIAKAFVVDWSKVNQ